MTSGHHPAPKEAPTPAGQESPEAQTLQRPQELQAHHRPTPAASGARSPETPHASGHVVPWLLIILLLTLVIMAMLMLLQGRGNWGMNSVVTPQGTVQRITFVSGWGVSTQVDTEHRSFLVRGATQLRKGARVETRSGPLGSRLCDAERLTCDELMRDE